MKFLLIVFALTGADAVKLDKSLVSDPQRLAFGHQWASRFDEKCSCKPNKDAIHQPPGANDTADVPCFEAPSKPITASTFMAFSNDECWLGCEFKEEDLQQKIPECLARGDSEPAVIVLGDSHAYMMIPAIASATKRKVYTLTYCASAESQIKAAMKSSLEKGVVQKNDIVLFTFDMTRMPPAAALPDIDTLYGITSAAGAQLAMVGDSLVLPKQPQMCLMAVDASSGAKTSCAMNGNPYRKNKAFVDKFAEMKAKPGFHYFDYLPKICASFEDCDVYVPGTNTVMYGDMWHLNQFGSLYLSPFMCSFLREVETAR